MKTNLLLSAWLVLMSACVVTEFVTVSPKDKNYYSARHIEFSMDEQKINIFFKPSDKFTATSSTPPALRLPLDQPFLRIAQSTSKVKHKYGSFRFTEQVKNACAELTVSNINFSETTIVIRGDLCGNDFNMFLVADEPNTLQVRVRLEDTTYNRITLVQSSTADEQVFGMGEQFSHVNLRGERVPVWVQEQGIGRGDMPLTGFANTQMAGGGEFTTYAPMPFYISTFKKSFVLHHTTRSIFDFRYVHAIETEVWDNQFAATIHQMDNPLDLIENYTENTGRLPALPDWAYGTILGIQGGTQIVDNQINNLQKSGAPLSAIWIQDWCGKRETELGSQLRWYWQTDENRYPDFKNFCTKMNKKGIAVLGYVNPFLTADGELYDTATARGFFVKNNLGQPYIIETPDFDACLIDLTNSDAFEWLKNIIKTNMIGAGLSGWMADYGGGLPWDAVLHSGISAEEYHNRYPVEWARLNREAIEETGNEGKLAFFSRTAFTNSNQHATLYWAGNQTTYWQKNGGLASVVPALLSSGISGMSVNHAEVGGFSNLILDRDPELLIRSIELCAFTPIFRTYEGVFPDDNIQVYDTPELRTFYARFARIHETLQPYLKAQMQAATEKGYPIIRHLYLHYPDDKNTYKIKDEYLLGSDILVAPVVKKRTVDTEVYIPPGEWQHLFTGEVFSGGLRYKLDAPIGTPPVFIKTDSPWKEELNMWE